MRPQLLKINGFFEKLPLRARKYRYLLWLVFIGITVMAAAGVPRFKVDMSWNALLGPKEPVKVAYDRFRAVFGSDEVLYLVYEAKDGNVFSKTSLAALSTLHKTLEDRIANPQTENDRQLNHITDITSLINASYLEGSRDTLISRDFVGEKIPANRVESEGLRKLALNHPDYPLIFCSRDGKYGGIIIRTDFNAQIDLGAVALNGADAGQEGFSFEDVNGSGFTSILDSDLPAFKTTWIQDYVPFMQSIYDIIGQEAYARSLTFHPAGNPELMGFLGRELEKEMALILLGSLVLILTVLGILFRSVSAILWPLVIIVATILWTVGSMGWSGVAMSDFINIVIFLLIAVGVADSVHILSGYLFFIRLGQDHDTAILSVYKKSGFACFLTSLTTAIGLLALSFAPIVAVQRLSLFGAAGVIFAFLITVFMLPLMLDILKPKVKAAKQSAQNGDPFIQRVLMRLESWGTRYPLRTILVFCLAVIVLVPGIARIQIDSNVLTIIRENRPIRKNFDVVDKHMVGTGNIEILVDTGVVDGLKDPQVLKTMAYFQKDLEETFSSIVHKTQSLVNVTRDAYRVLNEGRQEMYIIPEDPDTLSQTLFLFSTANPKDRRLLVSDDFRAARIIVNTRNMGSQEGLAFMKDVNRKVERHFKEVQGAYPKMKIESTGQIPLFLRMMDLISWSQVQSFGICLLLVSVIMLAVIQELRIGLIAIVPNLIPILTVFGIMGWLSIPLDVHTLLVVPIIIGISVDDTLHFITHFTLEMRKQRNIFGAIRMAVKEAGQAIVFTSLVLAVGYLAFLVCVNKGFAYFGFLSSIAVLTALLTDLVLLPAMLCVTSDKRGQKIAYPMEKEVACKN